MKRNVITAIVGILYTLVVIGTPLAVSAQELDQAVAETPPVLAPIIITEVQTGKRDNLPGTASDEFIELYNTTDTTIDITEWEVSYYTAVSTVEPSPVLQTSDVARRVKIGDDSGAPVLLAPHSYFVVYAGAMPEGLPPTVLSQSRTLGLATADRSLVLFSPSSETCELRTEDAVAWGKGAFGEGTPVPQGVKDIVMQRYVDMQGVYVDANDNSNDFAMTQVTQDYYGATPGRQTAYSMDRAQVQQAERVVVTVPADDCPSPDPEPDTPPVVETPDSPPSTTDPVDPESENNDEEDQEGDEDSIPVIPAGNRGLRSPQISELLPNPASPQTDDADEFIELYNPNDAVFDLSGYILEAGLTTKRRYIFPDGAAIQSKSFLAFFSADTNLTLSNTAGQVRLIDPLGAMLVQSDVYETAKDNQAWLLANGKWQWTTKPTPHASNIVSAPVVKGAKTAATTAGKKTATAKTTAATVKPKTTSDEESAQPVVAATSTSRTPLHPAALALVGGFALLYGAYEYRSDVANKFYQFRKHRTARRAARQSAQGR